MDSLSITLSGCGVTVGDVVRVARMFAPVALEKAARARVTTARGVVNQLAYAAAPIYGVNTALGANTGAALAAGELVAYQARAIRARAVGTGPRFPTDVVRAMLFARAAGMTVGGSAFRLSV